VFVAEPQRVQRFDSQGNYQLGWSKVGTDPGQFTRITDVQVGANGTVYVLEDRPSTLGRVQEFDADGNFLTTFGRGKIFDSGGLVLDAQGNVLVADDKGDSIDVFGPDGRLLRKFGQSGNAPGQLDFPTEMALSGNTLYVSDTDHSRIVRFDLATGRPTGYWPTDNIQPVSLALDGAGDLYVVNELGTLTKYRLP
jgi:DNA-binding beta-propeller fold protein YncE